MICEARRGIETKTGINVIRIIKLIFTQAQLCFRSHGYQPYTLCYILLLLLFVHVFVIIIDCYLFLLH